MQLVRNVVLAKRGWPSDQAACPTARPTARPPVRPTATRACLATNSGNKRLMNKTTDHSTSDASRTAGPIETSRDQYEDSYFDGGDCPAQHKHFEIAKRLLLLRGNPNFCYFGRLGSDWLEASDERAVCDSCSGGTFTHVIFFAQMTSSRSTETHMLFLCVFVSKINWGSVSNRLDDVFHF